MSEKDEMLARIEDYLTEHGLPLHKKFKCLNPAHHDRHPSMSYDPKRHRVHCFSCGADYDLVDLVGIEEGLDNRAAFRRCAERYGLKKTHVSFFPETRPEQGKPRRRKKPPEPEPTEKPKPVDPDTTRYLELCRERAGETGYFTLRGIPEEIVRRFGLGYDPAQQCVVLPCDGGAYVRRSVTGKRYLNQKGQGSPLWGEALLDGDAPVFVVEGYFDALSIWTLGGQALALNGSPNARKLIAAVERREKHAPLILIPDSDEAGQAWANEVCKALPDAAVAPAIEGAKDMNELLLNDRHAAKQILTGGIAAWQEGLAARQAVEQEAVLAYRQTSAGGQIAAFQRYIVQQARIPAIRTGFDGLDKRLDGGLYPGLYVFGAISSLGKTAFLMQVADQIAQQGQDVLVFSLEMSRFELMARSVSRETFRLASDYRLAKTVRGVLDGRRYAGYTADERRLLDDALIEYMSYADHIYIFEGDHETGLDEILRAVETHFERTGNVPVVIIDYLQIIAPVDVHFTDKQNTDRVVCGLKKLSRHWACPVIAISSFNRENYNTEVSMNAFKESGGIDYSADVLLGLQARGAGRRDFNIDVEKRKDPRELELKIIKNRSAALGDPIEYLYYPAFSCFSEH